MKSLFYDNNLAIEGTYIITIKGHVKSEESSKLAQESCQKYEINYTVWDAYNGVMDIGGNNIVPPEHLKNDRFMKMLKISNHYLSRTEIACALSHISLWAHCAAINKPIVILEHDAIMIRKLAQVKSWNSIVFLGSLEWSQEGWPIGDIPIHGTDGPNLRFICRAHAYAIDPIVAKNMLSHVLKYGITDSADKLMRADLFNITHQGLYATDLRKPASETTITGRGYEEGVQSLIRNDKLLW
jgi:hypothetical protein